MQSTVKKTIKRRSSLFASLVTFAAVIAVGWSARASEQSLGRPDFVTGYTLAAACLLLLLLGIRKRLITLPLGRVSFWARAHNYIGVFGLAVFCFHIRWPILGFMEQVLAAIFLIISGSGLLGWYLNRVTPKKLLVTGKDILYDDIPREQQLVSERAYALAIEVAGKLESATLAEYYSAKLAGYFQKQRSLAYAIAPSGRVRRNHIDQLVQLDRYLDADGRSARARMCDLVQSKDDLDFAKAMQQRLRYWVVVHVSCLWLFIFLATAHVWLAHRFHGS
jgi:hypothetical protein